MVAAAVRPGRGRAATTNEFRGQLPSCSGASAFARPSARAWPTAHRGGSVLMARREDILRGLVGAMLANVTDPDLLGEVADMADDEALADEAVDDDPVPPDPEAQARVATWLLDVAKLRMRG